MNSQLPPGCAAVDEVLAEVALGTLTGKQRVAALAHIDGCQRCAAEVEQLSAAADQLLALAPSAEPPVGFEAGVFARLGLDEARSRRRWGGWELWLAGAALAGVLFAGGAAAGGAFTGSPGYKQAGAPAQGRGDLETASFMAAGHKVGEVMVYPGNPTWLFMYVDDPAWKGALHCMVTVDQGRAMSMGQFWLAGGKGAWAAKTSQPAGRLSQAFIMGRGGQVLARAHLS